MYDSDKQWLDAGISVLSLGIFAYEKFTSWFEVHINSFLRTLK